MPRKMVDRICQTCGVAFQARADYVNKAGWGAKYCSKRCANVHSRDHAIAVRDEKARLDANSRVSEPVLLDGSLTCEVKTRKGETILIDAEDAARVRNRRWFITTQGYVWSGCKANLLVMHRFLMDAQPGTMIDHINGDRTDNRKSNLRFVTNQQNMENMRGARRDSGTGVRGVRGHGPGRYRAVVTVRGVEHHIGTFRSIDEATAAVRMARARLMTHAPECSR